MGRAPLRCREGSGSGVFFLFVLFESGTSQLAGDTRSEQNTDALSSSGLPPPPVSAPPLTVTDGDDSQPNRSSEGSSSGGEGGDSRWPSWLNKDDISTVAIAVAVSYGIRW